MKYKDPISLWLVENNHREAQSYTGYDCVELCDILPIVVASIVLRFFSLKIDGIGLGFGVDYRMIVY